MYAREAFERNLHSVRAPLDRRPGGILRLACFSITDLNWPSLIGTRGAVINQWRAYMYTRELIIVI